ncbi:MAG: YicC/YloC family endoribonuclease [Pseudomonadota bacterium]
MVSKSSPAKSLASMTGFATLHGALCAMSWVWEARSVNGRGFDLRTRLPDGTEALEPLLRTTFKSMFARGNITVSLRYKYLSDGEAAQADQAVEAVLAKLKQVATAADEAGVALVSASLAEVLSLALEQSSGHRSDDWIGEAKAQIADLAKALADAREDEGAALQTVMETALAELEVLVDAAADQAASRDQTFAQALSQKVTAMLSDPTALDAGRLEQEIAVLAVKGDVTEEIDRLRTHITAARGLLAGAGPVGRKFDFLMQEFNREANTLCSKSSDAALTATGLEMKVIIDRMREQVQNIE